MRLKEIISSIVLIFLSFFLFIASNSLPPQRGAIVGPAFFPKLLAVVIILCSLINIGKQTVYYRKEKKKSESAIKSEKVRISELLKYEFKDIAKSLFSKETGRITLVIIILAVYLILINLIGYFISTLLFGIVLMRFHGMTNKVWIIGASVSIAALVILIFQYWLNVPLPQGFVISLFI